MFIPRIAQFDMPDEWIYIIVSLVVVAIIVVLTNSTTCSAQVIRINLAQDQVRTYSVSIPSLVKKDKSACRYVLPSDIEAAASGPEFFSIPKDTLVYVWIDTFTAPPAPEATYTDVMTAVSGDTATFIAKNSLSPRLFAAYCHSDQALDSDYRREYCRWKVTKQVLESYQYDTIRRIIWIDGMTATSTRIESLLRTEAQSCLLFSPSYYDHLVDMRCETYNHAHDTVNNLAIKLTTMYEDVNLSRNHPGMDRFIQHYLAFDRVPSIIM